MRVEMAITELNFKKMKKRLFSTFVVSICLASLAVAQGAGSSLAFDGGSSHVQIGSGSSLNLEGSAITIEAWIFVSGYPVVYPTIIAKGNSLNSYEFDVHNSGALTWSLGLSSGQKTLTSLAGTVASNTWVHVAGTYDGSRMRSYINGIEVASVNASGAIVGNALPPRIGIRTNCCSPTSSIGSPFQGEIDEVRIWNRALTQDEIRHRMTEHLAGTEPGLVAYYRMDEGTDNTCPGGQDVCDASGNNNHGIRY
jgi:hypothetical protein